MNSNGRRGLLAFYNQTYHCLTMAAGLRSIGSTFRVDDRLAANMVDNVDLVLRSATDGAVDPRLIEAWKQVRAWLRGSTRGVAGADHGSDVYQLNALAYLTWTKLCSDPSAQHFAEENYTVPIHPDHHPGLGAIKQIWSNPDPAPASARAATLREIGAIVEKMDQPKDTKPKTSGLDS